MAHITTTRRARKAHRCDEYPRCERGILPGDVYERHVATPHDNDLGNEGWWVLKLCPLHGSEALA